MTPEQPKENNLYKVFDDISQGTSGGLPHPELVQRTVYDAFATADERTIIHNELLTSEDAAYVSQGISGLLGLNREYENLERTRQETQQLISELSIIQDLLTATHQPSTVLILKEREKAIRQQLTTTENLLITTGEEKLLEVLSHSQLRVLHQLEQTLDWVDGIFNTSLVGNYMRSVNKQFAQRWQLKQPESEAKFDKEEQETKASQWEWFIGARPPEDDTKGQERFDTRIQEYENLIADIRSAFKLERDISDTEVLQLLPEFNALQLAHFGKYGSFDMGRDGETEVPFERSERKVAVMLAAIERFITLRKRKEEPSDEPLEIIEPALFIELAILMISPHFDFASHYTSIVNQTGRYTPLSQEFDQVMTMLSDYKDKLGERSTPYGIKPSTKIKGAYELPNGEVVTGKQAIDVLEALMQATAENRCSSEDLRKRVYPHLEPDTGKAAIHRRISALRKKGVPIPKTYKVDPDEGYYIENFHPESKMPEQPLNAFHEGSLNFQIATFLSNHSADNPVTRDELLQIHFAGDPAKRKSLLSRLSEIRRTRGIVLHEDEGRLWLEIERVKQQQEDKEEGKPEKLTFAKKLEENIYSIKQKLEEQADESNALLTEKKIAEIVGHCIDTDIVAPGVWKSIQNMFVAAHQLRVSLHFDRKGAHLRGATFFQRHIDVLASLLNGKGDIDRLTDNEMITIQHAINESLLPFLSSRMGGDDRLYDTLALNATLNTALWIRKNFPEASIRSVSPYEYYHNKIGMQIILGADNEYSEKTTVYVAKRGISGARIEHYEIDRRETIYEHVRDKVWRETFSRAFDYVRDTKKPSDRFMIILAPNTLPDTSK